MIDLNRPLGEDTAAASTPPEPTLAQLEEEARRRMFGKFLVDNTLPPGPVPMFSYIELPPDGWSRDRPRSDWDEGELDELEEQVIWIATRGATAEQLERALAFVSWRMSSDVQRAAMLTIALKQAQDAEAKAA